MNTITRVIPMAILLFGSGCAKPDWIQQTLVTVDVTGVWVGSMGTGNTSTEVRLELEQQVRLELEQQGSKAHGYLRPLVRSGSTLALLEGPVDGSVGGDVLSFRVAGGRTLVGEMTVNGDEMKGYITTESKDQIGRRSMTRTAFLRRINSSPPPRSQ
jgi:hypothetical protein